MKAAALLVLTIFHTNDIHGWLDNFPAAAAVIRRHQGPKLVIDAGDWFQGTPEGTLSKGQAVMDVFNAVPYDVLVPGNHEYDLGEANLHSLVSRAKMPVLSANTYKEGRRLLRPWVIREVEGVKVGLFGLTTSKTKGLNFPENTEGLEFRSEIAEARRAVAELKEAGATVIVAVAHVGFEKPRDAPYESEQRIAHEVEGIDLIVGGHSHAFLAEPVRDASHGTLIAQAGAGLKVLGQVTLEIDRTTGKVLESSGRLVELAGQAPDPAIARLVESKRQRGYDVAVATATAPLERNPDGESSLGSWMTDCLRDWAGVDAAFQNGGGIRADIDAGPVTKRELFNVMPFDNKVVKLTLKPETTRAVVEHGLRAGKMLQLSGLKVRHKDRKLVSLEGSPRTAAALDFMVKGGDGFSPFAEALTTEYTKTYMRDVLIWCAETQKTIRPPEPGRLEAVN